MTGPRNALDTRRGTASRCCAPLRTRASLPPWSQPKTRFRAPAPPREAEAPISPPCTLAARQKQARRRPETRRVLWTSRNTPCTESRHFRTAPREQASPGHWPGRARFVQLRRLAGYAGRACFPRKGGHGLGACRRVWSTKRARAISRYALLLDDEADRVARSVRRHSGPTLSSCYLSPLSRATSSSIASSAAFSGWVSRLI